MIQTSPFSLENKKILVTGASSGIGRATAIECANNGATVILTARNIDRLNETLLSMSGCGHQIITADLTNSEEVVSLVDKIDRIDGVVLNSGINDKLLIKFLDDVFIDKMLSTNFTSPVRLLQTLMKKKKLNKFCSVVLMSSISAFYPAVSNGMYAASKGALNSFSKVLALELLSIKGRVNCIQPAFVETDMLKKYAIQDEIDQLRNNYPLGRFAQPEEVGYAVVYFLSDASQWVTGNLFVMDGGYTLR